MRAGNVESEADIEARENQDAVNETIMAVDMRDRGTIGCAYYVAREQKMHLMEDIKLAGLDIIDTLKVHAQPTVIIINAKSDERLEDHLTPDARRIDRGEDASKHQLVSNRQYILILTQMMSTVPTSSILVLPRSLDTKPQKISWPISNYLSKEQRAWHSSFLPMVYWGVLTMGKTEDMVVKDN